jgi:glycosyltransferase involved in cell wall biosynthesis
MQTSQELKSCKNMALILQPSLSIVVPALNEEKTLEKVVRATFDELAKLTPDHQVIIVNDGSSDSTGAIADRLQSEYASILVIHHLKPKGLGGALEAGFSRASKELISIITADGEFWPTELIKFYKCFKDESVDLVSSYVPNRKMPFYRKVLSWVWRIWMKLVLGEIPQLEGIYMAKKSLYVPGLIKNFSGMWNMEFILRAKKDNAKIVNTAMQMNPRKNMKDSKVLNLKTIFITIKEIYKLKNKLKK